MCENAELARKRHRERLNLLRTRGVEQVFLVACSRPKPSCRAIARRIWPIEDAPELPWDECPLVVAPSDQPWDGCEYFPYFGALAPQPAHQG